MNSLTVFMVALAVCDARLPDLLLGTTGARPRTMGDRAVPLAPAGLREVRLRPARPTGPIRLLSVPSMSARRCLPRRCRCASSESAHQVYCVCV